MSHVSPSPQRNFALPQAEAGTSVGEICRRMGVAEAAFYRWKKVCAGMGVSEIRRLKQLEEENTKLERLVAELTLDKTMLQDALRRKWLSPPVAAKSSATTRKSSRCRSSKRAGPWALGGLLADTGRGATLPWSCDCG